MHSFAKSLSVLLPLLRCPSCHSAKPLKITNGLPQCDIGISLHNQHLICSECSSQYPITEDFIPLMWDADVRRFYTGVNKTERTAVDANIEIYDKISDDYYLYTRQNANIAKRIQQAARKILPRLANPDHGSEHSEIYHVDFGCGPGHVLGWLKGFGLRQIGLDLSLVNLRNARKNTGCLVVCGNASNMPFADKTISLVTESSVLHHIFDWKAAVAESLRICKPSGGIILDSEPSKAQMAWSRLAITIFNARFPIYKLLSYIRRDKYMFRNTDQAKLNLQAEIHFQPGKGFPLDELESLFMNAGFRAHIIPWPTSELTSRPTPSWKNITLSILSARNPWNPAYGPFSVVAHSETSNSTQAMPAA